MQTKAQRAYWANRRKSDLSTGAQAPKARKVTALLATSVEEYKQLQAEYPHMTVTLRLPDKQQQLFSTQELRDV